MNLPDIFKHPDFVRFLVSRILSTVCMTMLSVAIGWQVYVLARATMPVGQAAFAVGMVGLVQFVPMVLLALPGGQAADRYDRKFIYALCLAGDLLIALALLGNLTLPKEMQLTGVFAVAAGFGVIRAFQPAASTSLMPMLLPRADLPRGIAWMGIIFQVGSILGPAAAGFLVVWSLPALYGIAAASFAIGVLVVASIKTDARPVNPGAPSFRTALEGLSFVWSNKIILGAISLDLVAVLLAGATALLPAFAHDILKTGPMGLGLLRASPAIGALLGGAYLARKPLTRHLGPWMLRSVAVFGFATIVFGLSKSLWLSCAALCVAGAADTISVFVRHNLVTLMTPDSMRGRVGAVNMLFISASNELGEFESGVAARFLGPVGAVLFGGVGSVITGLVWGRIFPSLQKADSTDYVDNETPPAPVATPEPQ